MRITGGEARGRIVPSPEGLAVRPTASKIRQAFFNILSAKVPEADFLDVFSGTGLMGLEALSRGANSLIAVDQSTRMVKSLEHSLKFFGYDGQVISGDFRQVLPTLPPLQFDIIYADPPYKTNFPTSVLQLIEQRDLLKNDGVLAIEHTRAFRYADREGKLQQYDRREYGTSALTFFALNQT